MDIAGVLSKFPESVLSRYDFTNARYVHALKPITGIICHLHGEFQQYSAQLRKDGSGCQKCGDIVRRAKRRSPQELVIRQAIESHQGLYTYGNAVYVNNQTKMLVTCLMHGDFPVTPNNHLRGKGCPDCGALRRGHRRDPAGVARSIADAKIARHSTMFEQQSREVHGDLYDYSATEYLGRRKRVTIICRKHGRFQQNPDHHISRRHGCPECSHHRSKGEGDIARFLGAFAHVVVRDRSVIAPKEIDIYLPDLSLAIEYCGEYWHSSYNADQEAKERNRHFDKHQACAAKGIRLITIYESEWLSRQKAIKRLLRNAIGKGRGRIMARKCEIRRAGHETARLFFNTYHPQGGNGSGEHYGLYHGEKLIACMRFMFGTNDRGVHAERTWTLSRYATRVAVPGGASKLFSAFLAEHKPAAVKSFSDNRYFSGGMYEAIGFALDEESSPDYQVWHPKTGLLPKTAWQRRNIPDRIRSIGEVVAFDPATDPRSERDMTYLLGASRLFDCGKKRWVWRAAAA